MVAQKGHDAYIKFGNGASPSESFTAYAGMQNVSLSINNNLIDVTAPDASDPGGVLFKETIGGVKSLSVSGDGLFGDHATQVRVNTVALSDDPHLNVEITIDGYGTYKGKFGISSFELTGGTDSALTFSATFENNGAVTYTADT